MKRLNLVQGSPEWHAHRATARNASEVSAVLGCSPYMTRQQLLHVRHTGIRPETSADQQRIFDAGHAIEAAQRPGAAAVIGEELYPVVGSEVVDGIELSASFDGLTMAEDIGYECKTLNDELRAALLYESDMANLGQHRMLPKHYRAQMEQQLMVSGAERILFVAASKDGEDVRRCWYYPDPQLRAEILAGWRQFDADLAAYVPPAASAIEKIVAEPVQALPAVAVRVEGQLAITDNFRAFEVALRDFLEHRLIREPKTDQDFADLDQQIKAMKGAEEALQAAEAQMLAQIQSVDQAKKTKDMLHKLVRENRLMAEKLLSGEKERRKGELVAGAIQALRAHIDGLNARLGKPYMPPTASAADFGGAIKGLKTIASMEDKLGTALANAKIAANEIADRIDANLKMMRELASEHASLFADTATLVLKAPDDCRAQIEARIAAHKAEQQRKLEAERVRIRAEEEARAREVARQEQEAREAEERRQHAAAEDAQRHEAAARAEQERQQQPAATGPETVSPAVAPAPTFAQVASGLPPAVIPMPTRAPAAPTEAPTLKLGEICRRLGFTVTADFLASLGFHAVATDKNAKLYRESDWYAICAAIARHVVAAATGQKAAA